MSGSASKLAVVTIISLSVTAGIVASSFMLSRFMLKIQQSTEKNITVKGVAEKNVRSDVAAFSCRVRIKAQTIPDGYAQLGKAKEKLLQKLDNLGFVSSMREKEEIDYNRITRTVKTKENGKETTQEIFDHYDFDYTLRIRTSNVDLVSGNILKIYEIVDDKHDIWVSSASYFLSDPEKYKLELVDQASSSATLRAQTVAGKCGGKLGELIVAKQGVIQITPLASNETSDWGVYDTSSIDKVMRLVMTMEFALK